jgi:hypothetical protein
VPAEARVDAADGNLPIAFCSEDAGCRGRKEQHVRSAIVEAGNDRFFHHLISSQHLVDGFGLRHAEELDLIGESDFAERKTAVLRHGHHLLGAFEQGFAFADEKDRRDDPDVGDSGEFAEAGHRVRIR